MRSLNGIWQGPLAEQLPHQPLGTTLRAWAAELAPFPNRWRRAARFGFITAVGAGVMATLQIANPLGLTLLVSFAAPEAAFSVATGAAFLIAAAAIQMLTLVLVGALVDSPVVHVFVFVVFASVSTYLIYGMPKLGRLWIWIQIPAVTAFYMVVFDHRTLGWDNAQMFGGLVVAVALLWLFNNVIWPQPAGAVLADSLKNTLERSRRRLGMLTEIFLGTIPASRDRGVASKLAYHLALLHPAARKSKGVREPAELLAAVMVAERIHNEIDRLCDAACTQAGRAYDEGGKLELRETVSALGAALEEYIAGIGHPRSAETPSLERFRNLAARMPQRQPDDARRTDALDTIGHHLVTIGRLLEVDPAELPAESTTRVLPPPPKPPFHLNNFLVRFCARHTVAMTLAFMAGLLDNSAAIHAALWLLMIGGPPSHGATARKFTMRAIGASGALAFAALGTMVLAPNFTTLPPYIAAIFVGVLLLSYLGEGGGELSFLSIGATAFVIAFSGPGPRPDMMGSIWTIWGISLGMIIRAVISAVSIERPNRTLAEEMERPMSALAALAPRAERRSEDVVAAHAAIVIGIEEMLGVAADAQLAGSSAGIDARNLVDALDTNRRLAFAMGNLVLPEVISGDGRERRECEEFDRELRRRMESWLAEIRAQLEPGELTPAPLRKMVAEAASQPAYTSLEMPRLLPSPQALEARRHVAVLVQTLERQLSSVSLS